MGSNIESSHPNRDQKLTDGSKREAAACAKLFDGLFDKVRVCFREAADGVLSTSRLKLKLRTQA